MNGGAVSYNGGDGAVAGELTPDALISVTTHTQPDADYSETITVTDVSMIAGHVKNIKPIVQKDKNAQVNKTIKPPQRIRGFFQNIDKYPICPIDKRTTL